MALMLAAGGWGPGTPRFSSPLASFALNLIQNNKVKITKVKDFNIDRGSYFFLSLTHIISQLYIV